LEEAETTFAEAAHQYSEGEEAQRKGVIGPMPIGLLQPAVLQEILRSLRPGEISTPRQLGEWHVLMRLEQLKSARFDEPTRERMLNEALDLFLSKRVELVIAGEENSLEPIHYDPEL
jgi:parvulin-like peptidyl-prolyl isomerase